jgi:hypothetical protein
MAARKKTTAKKAPRKRATAVHKNAARVAELGELGEVGDVGDLGTNQPPGIARRATKRRARRKRAE